MPSKNVPIGDRVLRYAPWSRLQKDENDKVIGLLPQALRMRDNETELSLTWVEYFDGCPVQQIHKAVRSFRSSMTASASSAYGIANVGHVKQLCAGHKAPAQVRILHEPEDKNLAHAVIRRYPRDDLELFELLAAEAFCDVILNKDVPS